MLVMLGLSFDDLVEYTEWQRGKWREWFRDRPEALAMSTGDHADGRFATVGEVARVTARGVVIGVAGATLGGAIAGGAAVLGAVGVVVTHALRARATASSGAPARGARLEIRASTRSLRPKGPEG